MGRTNATMTDTKAEGAPKRRPGQRTGPLANLVSMRMVILFSLMRRSSQLTQKRIFGLSEIEWRIMTQLGEFAPLSLNGLADLLLHDRGQLSRAVKGMVERGLLTRNRKPGGPEIEIDLSAEGKALREKMVERAIERDRRLTEGLDPAQLDIVRSVVEQMISRAEVLMEEERERWSS